MSPAPRRPPRAARRHRLQAPPRGGRPLGRRHCSRPSPRAGLAGDWSADYSTPGSESRAAADAAAGALPRSAAPRPSTSSGRRRTARARAAVAQRIDGLVTDADGLEGIGRGAGAARGGHLARRHDRRAADPADRAAGRDPGRDRQDADRARRAGERRRAAGRARRAADRERAGGRGLLGDGRPRDRRARAAAHVRVDRRGRACRSRPRCSAWGSPRR